MKYLYDVSDIYFEFVQLMALELGASATSNDYHELFVLASSFILYPGTDQTTNTLHDILATYGVSESARDQLVGQLLLRFSILFSTIKKDCNFYHVDFVSPDFLEVEDFGPYPIYDDTPSPSELSWEPEDNGDFVPERLRMLRRL